jgi:hypothetical protein
LAAITCISGPPWLPGKTDELRLFACFSLQQNEPAARPAQRLVGRAGHEIAVRHRRRVHAGRDEPREVRHVGHQAAPDLVGDRAEAGEVEVARIGAVARHDHLRTVLARERFELLVIEAVVGLATP